jgi:hypothetical protein
MSRNQRIGKTRRALAPRDREIAQLKDLVTALQAQNSAIVSSTSWRVTAPLRGWRRALRVFYWLVAFQLARRLSERRLVRRINSSGLFDTAYYKSRYPDVAAAGIDPVLHYRFRGRRGPQSEPRSVTRVRSPSVPARPIRGAPR